MNFPFITFVIAISAYIDSRIEKEGTDSKVSAPYSEVVEPNEAVAETLVESGLVEQQVEIEQIVELGHESIEYELEETNLIQTTDDAQSGIVIFHVNQAGRILNYRYYKSNYVLCI